MQKLLLLFTLTVLLLSGCSDPSNSMMVKNQEELTTAISNALPGDEIVMKNGIWNDVEIRFTGAGTESKPIVLRAETRGEVIISGKSDLKFGGSYLTVDGLFFKDGFTPSDAVIQFKIKEESPAHHCRLTNCVILDYNQMQRDRPDHWVEFWGRHNQLDHCYIAGKSNQGPTIRIKIKGNQNIRTYHQIVNNHFGPRPRKGGPRGETIQVGDSYTSMSPCNLTVANNLFERCNGEVEIISSKTNFNEFRNNVFYKCEGSLVTRHGNYCIIDGNYFIGDDNSDNIGGIRIINTGHWVTNNYFYKLKGQNFRSPLALMNGIPKSPLNRYNQVTDVVVAHNTWINCKSPWQFGVGSNVSQKDVLPASEIRSERPIRTILANNIIYNETGDPHPIVEHDALDGIQFEQNLINNQSLKFKSPEGLNQGEFKLIKVAEDIYTPAQSELNLPPYVGFEFETIRTDIFGNERSKNNLIGAVCQSNSPDPHILDENKYGPSWFSANKETSAPVIVELSPNDDLHTHIQGANSGDVLALNPGTYQLEKSLIINKAIQLKSLDPQHKAHITYIGETGTSAFQMHPKGDITLQGLVLSGTDSQNAFACLKKGMSSLYNVKVYDSEISHFDYILKAHKESMSDSITFAGCILRDCKNGIELSEETDDKGDYNVEFLTIDNCDFSKIQQNVIDYYRGGYDESTIGGNLLVKNSTFSNCGEKEENGILLNTRGIINVNIHDNQFKNNKVKLVALLWGAKNNVHANNELSNSGKIVVEENLKLKILY